MAVRGRRQMQRAPLDVHLVYNEVLIFHKGKRIGKVGDKVPDEHKVIIELNEVDHVHEGHVGINADFLESYFAADYKILIVLLRRTGKIERYELKVPHAVEMGGMPQRGEKFYEYMLPLNELQKVRLWVEEY